MNKETKVLSVEVKEAFKKYQWPGNIRELENILEHGVCFSKDRYIRLEDLPEYFLEKDLDGNNYKQNEDLINESKSLEELKLDFEKSIILELLNKYGNTVEGKK